MENIKFRISENSKYIDGDIFYNNNEFIFDSSTGKGEFSIMIGKGYCELSVARFNSRIYSFEGINNQEEWIIKNLIFPDSIKGELYFISDTIDIINYDGTWYTENWHTYYDKNNNYICMGDFNINCNDTAIEFCKNIVAVVERDKLKAIWIKNIKFY